MLKLFNWYIGWCTFTSFAVKCYQCLFEDCNQTLTTMETEECQYPARNVFGSDSVHDVSTCLQVIANEKNQDGFESGEVIMRMCIDGHNIKDGICVDQNNMTAAYCFCRNNLCNGRVPYSIKMKLHNNKSGNETRKTRSVSQFFIK